ncbi:MAG: hypothetical protein IJB70_04480, partial [Clostridia bacterium]|nr:hypothetical protein [Clostridia bacterium]
MSQNQPISLSVQLAKENTTHRVVFSQSVKKLPISPRFWYNKGNGGVIMEQWRKDARSEAIIVDLETLVPQD